jgi:hypothetical protein
MTDTMLHEAVLCYIYELQFKITLGVCPTFSKELSL